MRLLFVCGAAINDGELQCASWIKSIIVNLSDGFLVTILSTAADNAGDETVFIAEKQIHVLSVSAGDTTDTISKRLADADADIIVLFGTENPFHLKVLIACQQAELLEKTVVFAQGLCCVCAQHYAEGVPERIIKRYTLRDIIRRQNIRREQRSLEERAVVEKQALQLARHFIGRTTMDKAILRKYNPTAHYYKCNDVLRSSFYKGQWNYSDCEKHRIFISQYYYPLKGFHYLLEAAAQLKDKYPDIVISAAGYNPICKSLTHGEFKDSSYIRYIKYLIKKFELQDNIELLGLLSEERMKEEYLKANVFVMPSTIENSPNSLAEAMMLGVPAIASDVGGVTDYASHKEEAYIYPSSATYLLAYYIDKVFSDEKEAQRIGAAGRMRAGSEYDRERNIRAFEDTMRRIVQNK